MIKGKFGAFSPDGALAQEVDDEVRFLLPDLHQDIVGLVNLDGEITGATTYSPWGEETGSAGEASRFGFQGDPTDSATGLVNMVNRFYAPNLGRFTSRDSLFGSSERPTSLNQYTYGENNPVSRIDPLGLFTYLVCGRSGTWEQCKDQMNKEFKPNFKHWMRQKGGYSETFRVFRYSRNENNIKRASRRLYGAARVECPKHRKNNDPCNAIGHSLGGAIVVRAASFGKHRVFDFIMSLDTPWNTLNTDPCGRWSDKQDFHVHNNVYWINLYMRHPCCNWWSLLGSKFSAGCADRNERLEQITSHGGFWRNEKVARMAVTAVCTMRRKRRGYPAGTCHP